MKAPLCELEVPDKNGDAATDWREAAMLEAMPGFGYAEYTAAHAHAVRRRAPGKAAMIVSLDRRRLLEFLEKRASSWRSLIDGQYRSCREQETFESWDYMGWFALTWQGGEFEIALVPGEGPWGAALCIGDDAAQVEKFAQAITAWGEELEGRVLRYAAGWESAPDLAAEIGRVTWDDIVTRARADARRARCGRSVFRAPRSL